MHAHATIHVRTASAAYDVVVGAGASRHLAGLMSAAGVRPAACAVVCDAAVLDGPARAVGESLRAAGVRTAMLPVRGGEDAKTLDTLGDLCGRMLAAGIDRAGAVVAVGGGVVGDMAGFAAATFMRGIPCVQVPTTLLAMVDASVGGKTAVNLRLPNGTLAKNMVGSVVQPRLVACDPESLATLPARELRSGLAECVKHAIIADPAMLEWMAGRADPIMAHDPATLADLVARNVRIKAAIVGRDEREDGPRAVLNLGHTFAHAIEALAHDRVTHGEAVGIGTVAACRLGAEVAGLSGGAEHAVRGILGRLGLPAAVPEGLSVARLVAAMATDKKRRGGVPRLVVPHAPGDVRVHEDVQPAAVERAWRAVGAA